MRPPEKNPAGTNHRVGTAPRKRHTSLDYIIGNKGQIFLHPVQNPATSTVILVALIARPVANIFRYLPV